MLALEAKVPIIPVVVDGTGEVMPRDGLRLRPGKIRLKIGAPIETAHLRSSDREELMRQTREIMIRMHREIGGAGGEVDSIAA
jgi:1-acyl-sn-glycerol-3-phosphate acyltransferase